MSRTLPGLRIWRCRPPMLAAAIASVPRLKGAGNQKRVTQGVMNSQTSGAAAMRHLSASLVLVTLASAAGEARAQSVYWSDYNFGLIYRANLDGSGQTPILSQINGPLGISVDT